MPVVTRGDKELSLRFDTFPTRLHQRLVERITEFTDALEARAQGVAPVLTGLLRSEITPKVYSEQEDRVAGYVSVYAPGISGEYAKAATLEYGSDKVRKVFAKNSGLFARLGKRRIAARLTKPAHIRAFEYLRGPLEEMQPEIEAGLNETVAAVVAEDNA